MPYYTYKIFKLTEPVREEDLYMWNKLTKEQDEILKFDISEIPSLSNKELWDMYMYYVSILRDFGKMTMDSKGVGIELERELRKRLGIN